MADSETRMLRRTAVLLLAISAVRWSTGFEGPPAFVEGEDVRGPLLDSTRAAVAEAESRSRPFASGERLDPNRAAAAEWDRLPGVGPGTADAIVADRDLNGPFHDAGELTRVRGVGSSTVERWAEFLDWSAVPTKSRAPTDRRDLVDVNRADAEALQRVSGIGPALAERILQERAARPFRVLEDLLRVRGIGPATLRRIESHVRVGGAR